MRKSPKTVSVDVCEVRLIFTEDILGTWPADPDLHTRYISSKAPSPWLQSEEGDTLPDKTMDSGVTVFPCDDKGIFLYNYHVKGFLKEAANVLKDQLGVKNARSKVDNYVFVVPRRLYLLRDGSLIKEPDGLLERPLRAQTMLGPRVALVASEYLKAPTALQFGLQIIQNKEITFEVVEALLQYGAMKGIGQWRNGGFGQFTYEILQPQAA